LENDKKNDENKSRKRERDSQPQEDNDEYTKGLIVSFTAKKIEAAVETEKADGSDEAAEAAATEGGDEEKLSREDIKGVLTKFGVLRVGLSRHVPLSTDCNPSGFTLYLSSLIFVRFTAIADGVVCVQYVDYAKGDASGFLRFDQPEDAQKLIAAAAAEPEGSLTIAKHLVTFEALEGMPFYSCVCSSRVPSLASFV